VPDQIHIVKIRYRSGVNGKCATAYAKIPYGGMVDLSDKLARLLAIKQVRWYMIAAATPEEIAANRQTLTRWPEALSRTITRTHIDVLA
jgi:hypothetical protein